MSKKSSSKKYNIDIFNVIIMLMYLMIIIGSIVSMISILGIELKYKNINIISKNRYALIYTLQFISIIMIFTLPLTSIFTNRCGLKYTKTFYKELLVAFIITIFIVFPNISNSPNYKNNSKSDNKTDSNMKNYNKKDCKYNNVICYNSNIYSLYETYKNNNLSLESLEKLLKNNKIAFSYNENDELLRDEKSKKKNIRKILSKSHPDKIRNIQDSQMRMFINKLYITATNV